MAGCLPRRRGLAKMESCRDSSPCPRRGAEDQLFAMAADAFGKIGQFQILGKLGTGAHSTILHIRRAADGKQYALKIVPLESKEDNKYYLQAEHEFEIAQKFRHANLIKVFALEKPRDWLFRVRKCHLLIEYVNGKTLDVIPHLSVPRLVQVFQKIASGLQHMHLRGVYHADLKPNNVMLSRTGDVKIIDFGLAHVRGEHCQRVQGTPEYMAPEQAKSATVNELTDIYNLGATMYRLTTWRLPPSVVPTATVSVDAKLFATLLKPVQEFAPTAPTKLCDLIHKCLSYKAQHRPENVGDILPVLHDLCDELVKTEADKLDNMEW
jgi:serine/threonine protein kinase